MQTLKFTCCFTILLLSLSFSYTQEEQQKPANYFIALSPLSLINYTDGSSLRITIERKAFKHFTVSSEIGFYISWGNNFGYKNDPGGFIVKPCLKYYLKNEHNFNSLYIAIEYQYKTQKYSLADSIQMNNSPTYAKSYSMKRKINCISVKLGNFKTIKNRFVVEWYAGLGVRFFQSVTNLSAPEYDNILRGEQYGNSTSAGYFARTIGQHVYPNITLGIKTGFIL